MDGFQGRNDVHSVAQRPVRKRATCYGTLRTQYTSKPRPPCKTRGNAGEDAGVAPERYSLHAWQWTQPEVCVVSAQTKGIHRRVPAARVSGV